MGGKEGSVEGSWLRYFHGEWYEKEWYERESVLSERVLRWAERCAGGYAR